MKTRERDQLIDTVKTRFEKHGHRHPGIAWRDVAARLEARPDALKVLHGMEATGGEPDVVGHDPATGAYLFVDCSAESPTGRRSLCFDREARLARKENRPEGSAAEMAGTLGITLLTEAEHRHRRPRRVRHEDLELDPDARRHPCVGRRALLRPPLRHGVPLPQRRAVVLRRPGLPRRAARVSYFSSSCSRKCSCSACRRRRSTSRSPLPEAWPARGR